MIRRAAALVVVVLLAPACSTEVPEAEPFIGVWASEGWGIVLHVHDGQADVYETSATQCLLTNEGSARNIDDAVTLEGKRLVLDDGGRVISFERRDALPAGCTAIADQSPAAILAAAVAAVEEHYHPGVDPLWADRVASLVPPPADDDAALIAALEELLLPLADPQVALQTGGGLWSAVSHPAAEALAAALVSGALLPEAVTAGRDALVAADLGDGIRYLAVLRLGGFAEGSVDSQRILAAALDSSLDGATALVLDLRAASTGTETEALLAATRFVPAVTTVASVEARLPDGSMVPAGVDVVNPMPGGPFAGRVIVLVGPATSGPAELLALSLAALDTVTIVGEATSGSPRSPLVRTLPNGWRLGVPNVEVRTPDGVARVGQPLEPDVSAPLTTLDIVAVSDPGLVAAVAVLRS